MNPTLLTCIRMHGIQWTRWITNTLITIGIRRKNSRDDIYHTAEPCNLSGLQLSEGTGELTRFDGGREGVPSLGGMMLVLWSLTWIVGSNSSSSSTKSSTDRGGCTSTGSSGSRGMASTPLIVAQRLDNAYDRYIDGRTAMMGLMIFTKCDLRFRRRFGGHDGTGSDRGDEGLVGLV